MAINSKRKGSRGEREWAKFCREQGYDKVRRTQQYAGGTEESADCVGLPGIHQEVKRWGTITDNDLKNFMSQAIGDSAKSKNIPIVAHKQNYGKWYVTMGAQYFTNMYMESTGYTDWVWVGNVATETLLVTLTAEDWFKIYREWESGKRITELEGAEHDN